MLDTILLALQIVLALIGGYQLFFDFFRLVKAQGNQAFRADEIICGSCRGSQ